MLVLQTLQLALPSAAALLGCDPSLARLTGFNAAASGRDLHHPTREVVTAVPLAGVPFAVAISPAGAVYVSQAGAGSLARGTLPRTDLPARVPVGPLPSQVRVRPDGRTAYVGNQDAGTITVVRVATNRVVDAIALVPSILTLGISPDGRRLYALTDYHGVYVINTATRRVIDSIPAAGTGTILTGIAFDPSQACMYVAARDQGTVAVINTATDAVLTTLTVSGGRIQNVAVSQDGAELYATDIQRSKLIVWKLSAGNAAYEEIAIGSGVPRNAFDVAVTRDNAQIYVTTLADGKVFVLDRASRGLVGSVVTGGSPRYVAFDATGAMAVIPNESGWVTFVR